MKYDVIIIGAGLAGATCGYLFKKQDKKVLIIEKEKLDKKDKLCGGLLTKKSYELFYELFPKNKLKFKEYDHFYINNDGRRIKFNNSFKGIYRKDLDDYVLGEYIELGGEILDEVKDYDLDMANNKIKIGRKTYSYDMLVGADGVFSQLRYRVTGKYQEKCFAYEVKAPVKDELDIFFFKKFKGYGWIIPNKSNSVVGIGVFTDKVKIEDVLDKFLKEHDIEKKNVRGAFLPSGRDIYLRKGNIYFIGDAAGVISPILGEGIYYAMLTAKLLTENLNNYSKSLEPVFNKFEKEKIYMKFVYEDGIRNFVFNHHKSYILNRGIYHFIRKHL